MSVNDMHLCYTLLRERPDSQENPSGKGPCPYCGFDLEENAKKYPVALRAGTILNQRYIVGRVLARAVSVSLILPGIRSFPQKSP